VHYNPDDDDASHLTAAVERNRNVHTLLCSSGGIGKQKTNLPHHIREVLVSCRHHISNVISLIRVSVVSI
jgi:hypothetical protein